MATDTCDCGAMDLVEDTARAESTCRMCGTVVQAHMFSSALEHYPEGAEPRAGKVGPHPDLPPPPVMFRVRVGAKRARTMANVDENRTARDLLDLVDCMGARGFSEDVRCVAKGMCLDMLGAAHPPKRDDWHAYAACALSMACKAHGKGCGRTSHEIAALFANRRVTTKGLTAAARRFKSRVPGCATQAGLNCEDPVGRFVDAAGLGAAPSNAAKKRARELMHALPLDEFEGKKPGSVCAGVVYRVLLEVAPDECGPATKFKGAWARAIGVSTNTLDKMCKEVAAYAPAEPAPASAPAPLPRGRRL